MPWVLAVDRPLTCVWPVRVSGMTEPRPVFFLTHQFFGLRPRDTELCDELARLGYVAVAPDCFKGQTTGVYGCAIPEAWVDGVFALYQPSPCHLLSFCRDMMW
jgi:dienelactone hydrolase